VSTPPPKQEHEPGADGHELPPDATQHEHTPHPDRARARGNPEIEEIDVDRGLGKMERVSGN
jgi:hypothetical protein